MTDQLFIRLHDLKRLATYDCQVEWRICDIHGACKQRSSGPVPLIQLRETIPQGGTYEPVLLLSGYNVLTSKVTVARPQGKYLSDTVAFAVEEQLAEPIEEVHVALGSALAKTVDGQVTYNIAVVHNAWMDELMGALSAEGWSPSFATAENLLLQSHEDRAALLFDQDSVLFCFSRDISSRLEIDTFLAFFENYLQEKEAAMILSGGKTEKLPFNAVDVWIADDASQASHQAFESIFALCQRYQIEAQPHRLGEPVFDWLCRQFTERSGKYKLINLLQGHYRVKSKMRFSLPHGKLVAALFVGWLLLQLSVDGGTAFYFRLQSNRAYASAVAAYQQLYPGETVTNLREQLRRHIDGNEQSDMLRLMTVLVDAKPASPVTIDALNYDASKGELVVEAHAADMSAFEAYKQFANVSFAIDVKPADKAESGARSVITIRRSGT